ncbi:glycosyltransferase [Ethanoligenens harbinense]|uniref:Glycosyl transferase family 2 n=1 Tax=Ethanoligenens harbinense (strain DSM 18485 / JCM 12961 / CGMCC 1.5033 / YUAN-3) TaxID=663278 RepID=E6U851_ETHHY|nr:glycosyltransferase [Ethanoligenens harbinense]ADU27070.1 glycosyl transferase family 2 [Ethanoligenens harbinense YUAN-3]
MPFEPSVSIVIVNLNGLRHLDECFKSIQRLDYPKDKIEVVLVDNGSKDGSVEFVREKYRWVKLIRNTKNEGFAKPSNDGARAASGEYVAFLNNDMKVHKRWLAELVRSIEVNQATCAGSVILNWNGELLDFAGGSLTFYGMGFQDHFHEPIKELEPLFTQDKDLFFACGGAMLVDRKIFLEIGGFDEDFFAYFEDADLGWRMNTLGYRVVLSAKSRVNHKHHSTGSTFARERMRYLYFRNSLYTVYKNSSDEMLNKAFWPTLLMNNALIFKESGLNEEDYDLRISSGDFIHQEAHITHLGASHLAAQNAFVRNLRVMTEKRAYIQQNRKMDDDKIAAFFTDPFACVGADAYAYHALKYDLIHLFGIDQAFHHPFKRKVLLVTADQTGKKMAGPAIRYFEFAKAISKTCDVTLASYGMEGLEDTRFKTVQYTFEMEDKLCQAAVEADVILLQGFILDNTRSFPDIAKQKYLIFDLYDPFVIENIEALKDQPLTHRRGNAAYSLKALLKQLRLGDFFVAANIVQRDYWMGMLTSVNRISPEAYDISNNFSKMINLVPFGIADEEPVHARDVLRGVWPGINKEDFILIWGGGVWNWFDPISLIKAVKILSEERSDIKLFFLGVKRPNPTTPEIRMLNDAVALAKELDLYDRHVFFNFDWVDYNDRQNYLLEADAGVSFHFDTVETHFSFRTRILDYLWANLPIIGTEGDYFAELIREKEMGVTVGFQAVDEIAQAIRKLADDKAFYARCKEHIAQVAEDYRWSKVSKPIVDFCQNPVHLRDLTFHIAELESGEREEVREIDRLPSVGRPARRGSVQQMLYEIEQRQIELQKSIRRVSHDGRDANERLAELQTWSYMMNDRFNKFKGIANPFKFLKRLFRRR